MSFQSNSVLSTLTKRKAVNYSTDFKIPFDVINKTNSEQKLTEISEDNNNTNNNIKNTVLNNNINININQKKTIHNSENTLETNSIDKNNAIENNLMKNELNKLNSEIITSATQNITKITQINNTLNDIITYSQDNQENQNPSNITDSSLDIKIISNNDFEEKIIEWNKQNIKSLQLIMVNYNKFRS